MHRAHVDDAAPASGPVHVREARAREQPYDILADAAGGAGYDCRFVFESHRQLQSGEIIMNQGTESEGEIGHDVYAEGHFEHRQLPPQGPMRDEATRALAARPR